MGRFEELILKTLGQKDYTPVRRPGLCKKLGISDEDKEEFIGDLKELVKRGRVVVGSKNLISLPGITSRITGEFRANPRGFGFIIPTIANSHGDLFVGPDDTLGAMNGDLVTAKVLKKGQRAGQTRYVGVITDILERGLERFVGTVQNKTGVWLVEPEGKGFFQPVVIEDIKAKNAREGDKVVVDVVSYPTGHELCQGVIVEVVGRTGEYDSEIKSIIVQHGLPEEFDEECVEQARTAGANFKAELDEFRDDITSEVILTIDPPDAKDFDDAISLVKNKDGNWVLGVHIADVSTFIPMGSPLDLEAGDRGNSIYLPGKVIPMLPEVLSNGICSLQPGQKRYAKSAYITYDINGNVLGTEFASSLIKSRARLTYLEADAILKGHAEGYPGEVVALLKDMDTLAKAIEARRNKRGMLHLDLPETELVLDDDGKVVDAEPADDCYPHTIIEMFMVEANEAVAALLDRFGVPFMRRIHPEPEGKDSKEVGRFVKLCGLKIPRQLDRKTIQDLLDAVKGKDSSFAINMYILRSLQKAEYSPMHIGHFALASTHYCHFTSPIRRYADLMVHRLLQCYVEERLNKIGLDEVLTEVELREIGNHISFTEQRAVDAERELKSVLILQMLSERVGEELNCVVTGLTNFGVFVQCLKFGIEGLIEPGDLGLDEWKYDKRNEAVVGKYSGKSVHLGQGMRVKIVSVNVAARQLCLAPVESLVGRREIQQTSGGGGRRGNGKRKKRYKNKSRR